MVCSRRCLVVTIDGALYTVDVVDTYVGCSTFTHIQNENDRFNNI